MVTNKTEQQLLKNRQLLKFFSSFRAHFTSWDEWKMLRGIMYKNSKQLSKQRERYMEKLRGAIRSAANIVKNRICPVQPRHFIGWTVETLDTRHQTPGIMLKSYQNIIYCEKNVMSLLTYLFYAFPATKSSLCCTNLSLPLVLQLTNV